MDMPLPDYSVLRRRGTIARDLRRRIGSAAVIDDEAALRAFEMDGLTVYRQIPLLAVLPANANEVSSVLEYCHQTGLKLVPRGAGTSLSGGALPIADGVLLGLSRLNRILDIDYPNRAVTVQPGVRNAAISDAVRAQGFYYAPDPSSQIICSIGGNIAENAGGVHCLKYGLTTNNLLGLEIALVTGERMRIGGKTGEGWGYDLLGLITGSEGLLAVVTEATLRILPQPPAARAVLAGFKDIEAAGACVAHIIAGGIIPAGLEMMDRLAIQAAEAFVKAGYPIDAEALLIMELDGVVAEVDNLTEEVAEIARRAGAFFLTVSQNDAERQRYWAGRKAAFPAIGRLTPDYLCMDGTIPRKKLPEVLKGIGRLADEYGLRVANVFHAGDGNLHPLIMFDANQEGQLRAAEALGAEILKLCVAMGGVLTGEHGVGVEKRDLMPLMFSTIDLEHQQRVKCAFDPRNALNPGKVFPTLHRCAELGRLHVHQGRIPFPDIPRF